ncbi:MAG: ArnT family glycosyltransferase [Pseudomonadota bacterium]
MIRHSSSKLDSLTSVLGLIGLAVLSSYILLSNLDRAFSRADEAMYVRRVQGMIAHSSVLTSYIDDRISLNKPPLAQWLAAISVNLLGESATSHRLPNALAGAVVLWLVVYLTRRWSGSLLAAALAGLALLSCNIFTDTNGVRSAGVEALLSLFTVATLGIMFEVCERALAEKRSKSALTILAGVLFGLGILTKSLAICVTLLIIALFLTIRSYQSKIPPRQLCSRLAPSLKYFALGALPLPLLYYSLLVINYPEALKIAFSQEIVERFKEGYHNSDQPFFYLKLLLVSRRLFAPEAVIIAIALSIWGVFKRRDAVRLFLVIWALLPLILFSFLSSRLPWYAFTSVPPLAMLIGVTLAELIHLAKTASSGRLRWIALVTTILTTIALVSPFPRVFARVQHDERIALEDAIRPLRNLWGLNMLSYVSSDVKFDRQQVPYFNFLRATKISDLDRCKPPVTEAPQTAVALFITRQALNTCDDLKGWSAYTVIPVGKGRKSEVLILLAIPSGTPLPSGFKPWA